MTRMASWLHARHPFLNFCCGALLVAASVGVHLRGRVQGVLSWLRIPSKLYKIEPAKGPVKYYILLSEKTS